MKFNNMKYYYGMVGFIEIRFCEDYQMPCQIPGNLYNVTLGNKCIYTSIMLCTNFGDLVWYREQGKNNTLKIHKKTLH